MAIGERHYAEPWASWTSRRSRSRRAFAGARFPPRAAIAGYLTDLRKSGSEDDTDALDLWSIDAATVTSLREQAATILDAGKIVASPPRKVSQRSLDIQDGRVLTLIDMIWRAFRVARRTDRSILIPELNRILWRFETRTGAPKAAKEAAPPASEDPKKNG